MNLALMPRGGYGVRITSAQIDEDQSTCISSELEVVQGDVVVAFGCDLDACKNLALQ